MFPVDSLAPPYCEERSAEEAARKLAQKRAADAAQLKAPVATKHAAPSSLAQSLQAPGLSRAGSSGVLGSIFQGFRRTGPGTPSPATSMPPSRTQTPILQSAAEMAKAELEAKKRDTDICALPGWH